MRTLQTTLLVAALSVPFVVGCSQSTSSPESGAAGTADTLANAACPLMGGPVDEAVTVDWNGQTVAFCCADCIPAWNELSEDEKAEKLAAADTPTEGEHDHDHEKMSHDAS